MPLCHAPGGKPYFPIEETGSILYNEYINKIFARQIQGNAAANRISRWQGFMDMETSCFDGIKVLRDLLSAFGTMEV